MSRTPRHIRLILFTAHLILTCRPGRPVIPVPGFRLRVFACRALCGRHDLYFFRMVQFQPERKTLSFSRKGDGEPNVSRRNAEKRNGEQGEGAPMEAIQDNGTFRRSEELLRDGIAPQQVMSNLIIGKLVVNYGDGRTIAQRGHRRGPEAECGGMIHNARRSVRRRACGLRENVCRVTVCCSVRGGGKSFFLPG